LPDVQALQVEQKWHIKIKNENKICHFLCRPIG
jgi:hypothetical protein